MLSSTNMFVFVILLVLCLRAANSKYLSDSANISPNSSIMVSKFCFDATDDPINRPGHVSMKIKADLMHHPHSVYVMLFDDQYESWPQVSTTWDESTCLEKLQASRWNARLPVRETSEGTGWLKELPVRERSRPRFWYLALVNCGPTVLPISYSFRLTNPLRGWQQELGFDQLGIVHITGIFVLLLFLIARSQWRYMLQWSQTLPFTDLIMILMSLTTNLAFISQFLALVHWLVYTHDGIGIVFAYVTSRLLWNLSKTTLMFTYFVTARGDSVTSSADIVQENQLKPLATLAAAFAGITFAIEMYSSFSYSEHVTSTSAFDTPLGVLLVAIDLIAGWKYIETMQRALKGGNPNTNVARQEFLRKCGWVFAAWFMCLPLSVLLAHVAQPWYRFRVVSFVIGATHIFFIALTNSFLKPSQLTKQMFSDNCSIAGPKGMTKDNLEDITLEDTGII